MSVASFELDPTDLTAQNRGQLDQNGDRCALIKIETTEQNFSFDVGTLGITLNELQNSEHPSEIWLFVPNGVKSISIQHPILGIIRDYDLQTRLQKAKTYVLKLTTDQVSTVVSDYSKFQKLHLNVFPKKSKVYINGTPQNVDFNGDVDLELPLGIMTYRVESPRYHHEESKVVLDNPNATLKLNIRLKQAYGYLNIESDKTSEKADIFVDNIKVGAVPMPDLSVNSGKHKLLVRKKYYLPYTEEITIKDSTKLTIKPVLQPNSADIVILANDKNATIYIDGESVAVGRYEGLVESGKHIIECRKASHTTISKSISVEKGRKLSVNMDAPSPIYGMLQIATEPNDVTILIDGNIVGKTPYYTNKILIGRHHIELQKHGYKTETKDIKIDEAKLEAINIKLTDYCEATISTLPAWAVISVNDNRYTSPHKLDVYAGNYKIDITAKGYSKYSKTLFLDGNTKDFTVTLSRNYVRNNEFYIAAGYNPIGFQSINGNIGFYYHNINVEGVYSQGMSSSETIYWNYVGDSDYSYAPEEVKYKATAYGGKVGYGLRLSSRFRLTPQIGAMLIKLKSDNSYDFYDGATAINASASLKFSYYINSALGISVAPEYRFGVNKGEGFTNLSDLSSTIKNYVDGVECNVALFLCF